MFPLLFLAVLISFTSMVNGESNQLQYDCYAKANEYGEICVASGPAVPHPGGLTIGYEISVSSGSDTQVCCKARGSDGTKTIWVEFLCHREIIRGVVPWANGQDVKAIKCKGVPLGVNVQWS